MLLLALSPLLAHAALSDYTRLPKTDMTPCVPLAGGAPCVRVGNCGDYPPNPQGPCNITWLAEQCIDFVQELSAQVARSPHGQAVAPAADRLLEVPACIRGYALRPGRSHGAKSGIHTTLRLVGCSLLCLESDGPPPKPSHRPSHIQA
jgi:hypothetical protein